MHCEKLEFDNFFFNSISYFFKMDRKDIPNFIGKHVITTGLKATKWNEKIGWAIGWNEKRERFAVKMVCNGAVKYFKPYNLIYQPITQNKKEKKLVNLIVAQKLVDFEHGMELFGQLESNDKYMHTFLKIHWFSNLIELQCAKQDKGYLPKIETALESLIEISQFEDLVVWAKIQLARIFLWTGKIEQAEELCMSSVGAHYGYLPELFSFVCMPMEHNAKDLYFQSKHMLANKTCHNDYGAFVQASATFLDFCKDNNFLVNIMEECAFLRKLIECNKSSENFYSSLAQICILEENYEDALLNIQIYQEKITLNRGNVDLVSSCYDIKVECHIKLGNKLMAKKVLKKLKRFINVRRNVIGVNEQIEDYENEIAKMSNANSTAQSKENQEVRTRTQCSAPECKKSEPQVGAFKHCGRCQLKYYCSINCQKKHWKNGHKEECEEFEN